MKALNTNFLYTPVSTKFLFLADTTGETGLEARDLEKEAADALRSPYSFNLSHIKLLEKKELNSEERKKLNGIAEFHLSLMGDDSTSAFPNRILFGLEYSILWKELNPELQRTIKARIVKEYKQAEELTQREVSTLTNFDIMNLNRLYRSMRRNKYNDILFQKIEEKIIEKTNQVLQDYKLDENEKLVCINPTKTLTTRDKLFILEAQKLFPTKISVQRMEGSFNLEKFSTAILEEFKRTLGETGEEGVKKRMSLLPHWELLADGLEDGDFAILSPELKTSLEVLIGHAQTGHFLSWIDQWQKSDSKGVLLPEHLTALRQIQNNAKVVASEKEFQSVLGADDLDFEQIIKDWQEASNSKDIKIKDSNGDYKTLDIEGLKKKRKEFLEPQKQLPAFIKTRKAFGKNKVIAAVIASDEDFKKKYEEKIAINLEADEWVNFYRRLDEDLGKMSDRLESLTAEAEKESDGGTGGVLSKEMLGEAKEILSQFKDNPLGDQYESEKLQVESDLSEHIESARTQNEDIRQQGTLIDFSRNGDKHAHKFLEKYKTGLRERLQTRNLYGADLLVLLKAGDTDRVLDEDNSVYTEIKNEILGEEHDDLIDELTKFRKRMGEIIGSVLDELETDTGILSDSRRFAEWLGKLSNAGLLGDEALRTQIDILKNIILSMPGSGTLTTSEILDATKAHFREDIFKAFQGNLGEAVKHKVGDVLDGGLQPTVQQFQSVMDNYDRAHRKLYDIDQNYKAKTGADYIREKQMQTQFKDGLEQRNNEALKGITENDIGDVLKDICLKATSRASLDFDQIEGAVRDMPKDLYKKIIVSDDPAVVLDYFKSKIPAFATGLGKYTEDSLTKIGYDLGRQVCQLQANVAANSALEGTVDFMMQGDGDTFPGFETLNEVRLQMSPALEEIRVLEKHFTDKIEQIQNKLRRGQTVTAEELEKTVMIPWENFVKPKTNLVVQDLETLLTLQFPENSDFIKHHLESFLDQVKKFEKLLFHFKAAYKGKNLLGEASEKDMDDMLKAFSNLVRTFDLDTSSWKDRQKVSERGLRNLPHTLEFLDDELGLLEPGGERKAKQQYETNKKENQAKVDKYVEYVVPAAQALEQDLKKMNPEKFSYFYGMTKGKAAQQLEIMKDDAFFLSQTFYGNPGASKLASETGWTEIGSRPTHLPGFFERGFFDTWMGDYLVAEKQGEAILHMNHLVQLSRDKNFMINVQKDADRYKVFEKERETYKKDTSVVRKPFRLLNSVKLGQWFSVIDIFRMLKEFGELYDRNQKRREEEAMAYLGMTILGDTAWGREFQRKRREYEEQRVSEFEKTWEDKNFDDWRKRLYATKKKDEARAMINLLVKDGYMRWDDVDLWRTLGRFQSKQKFDIPADLQNKNLAEITGMCEVAVTEIWSSKIFSDWNGSTRDARKKQMESNQRNFSNAIAGKTWITEMTGMLQAWENGDESVDSANYEYYLHKAFLDGEINGSADSDPRWYYLIKGLTTKNPRGMALLSHEAMFLLKDEVRKEMPYFDMFTEGGDHLWTKDGRLVPEGTPGARQMTTSWKHSDIEAWGRFMDEGVSGYDDIEGIKARSKQFFFEFMAPSPKAVLRLDKQARNGGGDFDHDDGWLFGAQMTYNNATQLFNKRSEGADIVSQPFARNFVGGSKDVIKSFYKNYLDLQNRYGTTSGWGEMKREKLKEMGEQLRMYYVSVHTMAGNVHENSSQYPLILDRSNWETGSTADNARVFLNDMVGDLLQLGNKQPDNFGAVKDFVGARKSNDWKYLTELPEHREINSSLQSILTDETLFSDTRLIEQLLANKFGTNVHGAELNDISTEEDRSWDPTDYRERETKTDATASYGDD